MSPESQLTIVFIALMIVRELIGWLRSYTKGEQKQEQTDAEERGRWMTMLDKVLDRQQEKFADLARTFKAELAVQAETMQQNHLTAQAHLIERMTGHMGKVTAAHTAKLELMHMDIKTVPAEVQRVLAGDLAAQTTAIQASLSGEDHAGLIKEAVSTALKPVLGQIEEKLDQLPGETTSRQMIREEVAALQQQVIERVTGQITPLLDKLDEIAVALDTLKPTPVLSEAGDQVPVDTTVQGEDNHVGNPS